MARRVVISYWVLPIISGLVWFGTLLGMLLSWIVDENGRRYANMKSDVAFISSIGADRLGPLFITGCVITSVFLDLSFVAERWLRHRGRLIPNSSVGEKTLAYLTIVFALLGTVGLICLSIFDSRNHKRLHNTFLLLFIVGYMISAIFLCWEYQRLKIKHRAYKILRISFWVKLGFIIVELSLCVAFAACSLTKNRNSAAVLEWIISFIFTFYVFSFVIDLYPAVRTKNPDARFPKPIARDTDREDSVSNQSQNEPTQPNMETV
ncbi:Frag1/DRAM/Sfk1 [Dactylonectria macrodidyma]|uniref:Frag1/DRAM/Sfk1 n=1 Tax=Dactylonectria macrodidyma TaxID=307937 RepID=A0A9P9FN22_9HYPO|nr:Frag1/DRAM/Sfk1 [Dactylonectria macrodidyma]